MNPIPTPHEQEPVSTASCYNCRHWQPTYLNPEKTKRTVIWEFNEPDWSGEKSCEIFDIDKQWTDRRAIGAIVTKYQSGSVKEVKEAVAVQCLRYEKERL
jgi:hypothetical protein